MFPLHWTRDVACLESDRVVAIARRDVARKCPHVRNLSRRRGPGQATTPPRGEPRESREIAGTAPLQTFAGRFGHLLAGCHPLLPGRRRPGVCLRRVVQFLHQRLPPWIDDAKVHVVVLGFQVLVLGCGRGQTLAASAQGGRPGVCRLHLSLHGMCWPRRSTLGCRLDMSAVCAGRDTVHRADNMHRTCAYYTQAGVRLRRAGGTVHCRGNRRTSLLSLHVQNWVMVYAASIFLAPLLRLPRLGGRGSQHSRPLINQWKNVQSLWERRTTKQAGSLARNITI